MDVKSFVLFVNIYRTVKIGVKDIFPKSDDIDYLSLLELVYLLYKLGLTFGSRRCFLLTIKLILVVIVY